MHQLIIVGILNCSKVHRGKLDLTMLQKRIKDNIEKQLPLLPQGIQRLLGTRIHGSDGVAMKGIIAAVCSDHKMSKKESAEVLTQWVKNERSHRNLFGVINAVTRAGQTLNNDSWVKFDHLGGQLLNYETNRWDLIKKRAESYSDTDLEKIFI